MANFADLLTPKSKETFETIIFEKIENERKSKEEYERKQKEKYASRGFTSIESLIQYLKTTGRRVYFNDSDFGIYFQWDNERNAIRHQVYENNDIDMTIGYTDIFYTIDEFTNKFEKKISGKSRINEYGYVDGMFRNDEHPIEEYNNDDHFIFIL